MAEELLATPGLVEECRSALPVLRAAAMTPAGEHGVRLVVGRRFELYPQPDRNDSQWSEWWADYFAVLADLPQATLEAGMAEHVRGPTAEFLPKPGALRKLALNAATKEAIAYLAARRAIERADEATARQTRREDFELQAPRLKRVYEDPEVRVQAVAEAKAWAASIKGKTDYAARPRPLVATPLPVDEMGARIPDPREMRGAITKQMMDLLRRQGRDFSEEDGFEPDERGDDLDGLEPVDSEWL